MKEQKESAKNRMLGCLYGQAVGDALGLGTEFMDKKEVKKRYPHGLKLYSQIVQDQHRRRWHQGAWTDDTDMMLCILRAFRDDHFDVQQVAKNFKEWADSMPLGIGKHILKVLCLGDYVDNPEYYSKFWWERSGRRPAANGGLMRSSVVGLAPTDVERQAV